MAIPLSLPYPYLCKVEINNESLKTGNMKIIDLTKESFVENIPIYDGWNLLDVISVSHKSTRIAFSPDFHTDPERKCQRKDDDRGADREL